MVKVLSTDRFVCRYRDVLLFRKLGVLYHVVVQSNMFEVCSLRIDYKSTALLRSQAGAQIFMTH